MKCEIKELNDGIGFVSQTHEGYPILSTFKETSQLVYKIGVSLCTGCAVKCTYCFTNSYTNFRPLTVEEIVNQVKMVMTYCRKKKLLEDCLGGFWATKRSFIEQEPIKISFKQMGDPLLNPGNVISSIIELSLLYPKNDLYKTSKYPYATFVVSTSGPKTRRNSKFFQDLNDLHKLYVVLQFSLHTTSNAERSKLSPAMPMMSIEEIAEVSNNSVHPVTLNFVMFDGFEYSADKIISLFNPHKVFIKINYIDRNTFTDALDLRDSPKKKVMAFYNKLARRHFSMAFRGN